MWILLGVSFCNANVCKHICMGFPEGSLLAAKRSCQVLYVSGVPGTGKTASVLEVVRRLRIARTADYGSLVQQDHLVGAQSHTII